MLEFGFPIGITLDNMSHRYEIMDHHICGTKLSCHPLVMT
jgi:hypothetical protein